MDIEEFLDRELSELGLQTGRTEKAEKSIELPDFEGDFGLSPLSDSIKASLSKGNLEQAEQSYIQLWRVLLQQRLTWNRELYEQLSVLSRQFSDALNYAYSEIKRKADNISARIAKARELLQQGKKELPFRIYMEIEEINNSIPNVFFEEKRIIQEQIINFYKELKNTTDNELAKRVSALINEISQLTDKINTLIKANDIINATEGYNRCIELYTQVPEGFLRHKNSAGMRLLEIYKTLSIYTEISNLQNQLSMQPLQLQQRQQQAYLNPALQDRTVSASPKAIMVNSKKERAKRNIEKGFYNEAYKEITEVLGLEPDDAEAKALKAKIKTLQ